MGNLSIFVGKQQETNQSMRLKRNKEVEKGDEEEEKLDTHGKGWDWGEGWRQRERD